MIKYIIVAHKAELPKWESNTTDTIHTVIMGIGKDAAHVAITAMAEKIVEENKEVAILLAGTAASYHIAPGTAIEAYSHPLSTGYPCAELVQVDTFVSNIDEHPKLKTVGAFDMESKTVMSIVSDLQHNHPNIIKQISIIKVISDSGCSSMNDWESSTREKHPILKEAIERFIAMRPSAICNSVKYYQDYPIQGVRYIDLTPSLTPDTLICFANWYHQLFGCVTAICPESRALALGGALSQNNTGFVPIRKTGKVPNPTREVACEREYGATSYSIRSSDLTNHPKLADGSIPFVILDDVLATGGTAEALYKAIDGMEVETDDGVVTLKVIAFAFITSVTALDGLEILQKLAPVHLYTTID